MKPKQIALAILILAFICLGNALLSGCAGKPKPVVPQFSAPAVGKVEASVSATKTSIESAKSKAVEVAKTNDTPLVREMLADLERANAEATQAQVELAAYSSSVQQQTDLLNRNVAERNKALEQANYWQGKHAKALREIWFWRILAMAVVGSVLAWIGIRLGIRLT